ncbi:hypothetical protein INS49_012038 [Diaporthe citri]|uniref:uncharacterized protein n=1 Tax=Diaporthe citri TaxID=83186 RepID=UPI001C7FF5F7|nr:uncharacterized protein INS49_012038 [Diaporthe citri]KAG6360970.1 hypothetical protein INS49_012038 [Diaporthe citri]
MATSETARWKADAVTRMVQDARLQTTFLQSPPGVRHTVRNTAAPGSSLREYWERKKYIGCGGFGSVHLEKCVDIEVLRDDSDYDGGATNKIGSLRAVKEVSQTKCQSNLSEEFLRELHSLVFFTQPKYEYHFVQTYGWYEINRTLYIAMEYLELGDLQSHLEDRGPIKETDAKFISKQILRGLEFMHEEGFVHRDLKPSNLLIKQMPPDGPWWVKISDFGLSENIEQSWTLPSTVCGTPGFMAPELLGLRTPGNQLSQLDKWKAVDIWAFGETVYRLLTEMSPFGDNKQDLGAYFRDETDFPVKPLKRKNVSADGIEFIRYCMAPCPTDRPSANAALELLGWPMTHCKNRNMSTQTTRTLSCKGKQPPFILFTPDGDHLLAIEAQRVLVWNIESKAVVNSYTADYNTHFCHGSIHPDGTYLCVTQKELRKPLILGDAISFEYYSFIDDYLDKGENHAAISTFSPDGETLVTARSDVLCQIDIKDRWTAANQYCVAAIPNPNRDRRESRIEELRFTENGSELVAACHDHVVVMDTATNCWFKRKVIDYPCSASPSSFDTSSSGLMVACGSTTGELWLQTAEMGCWVRLVMPSGGPGATSEPVENVRFSATGNSILYNIRGRSGVKFCRSAPLDQSSYAYNLNFHPGRRLGHSLTRQGIGATALGGDWGASVIFWKYEFYRAE